MSRKSNNAAVRVRDVVAQIELKLRLRNEWLQKDNPGMACKYHNHAEGLLEVAEARYKIKVPADASLVARLQAVQHRLGGTDTPAPGGDGVKPPREYDEWCAANGADHAHCPHGCEHPQPVVGRDGKLYCMRCWFVEGVVTEMVACTPATCD